MTDVRVIVHRVASTTFLAALGIMFVGGLIWALSPEDSTGFTITEGGVATPEAPPEDQPEEPTPAPTPTQPEEEEEEAEDAEELIAAARDPSDTTVQVLEAGGGMGATNAAADHLSDELGYQVINVTSARVNVGETTVWFTEGNEDEALALRAREPRVAVVEANQGLNEGTDLHVLVGPNWDD